MLHEDDFGQYFGSGNLHAAEHIPGKKEAKVLRYLRAYTGMVEEEIRKAHRYRVLLAEASRKDRGKLPRPRKQTQFEPRGALIRASRETKQSETHPHTKERYLEICQMYDPKNLSDYGRWYRNNTKKSGH